MCAFRGDGGQLLRKAAQLALPSANMLQWIPQPSLCYQELSFGATVVAGAGGGACCSKEEPGAGTGRDAHTQPGAALLRA